MELVLRSVTIYFFLLLLFVIAGKRQLAEVDPFRLVLLLIISEATQQALVSNNNSVTGAVTVITVLIGLEMIMSSLKARYSAVEKIIDGGPLILVIKGKTFNDRMKKEKVNEEDILSSARTLHGIERMDQIKYAILEESGEISIVPSRASTTT